ncbi:MULTISPECIES: hypothetical protein [unclassified Coleofasciculus]|uniref:hypothetical protein n=1 Tax=unclassified Coleofasciculus TaxID=2692782 RepID=UPI001881EF1A|nr:MULTISPECIES: hypothetical protein [unclassified Coleofasciculus]MBE9128291.1 hypothetical protein [Coleofasciculus sp. LEGE 07081]MBE9151341.1 hypothetical protein [Coleofasciculus sp. LEGE 07092]
MLHKFYHNRPAASAITVALMAILLPGCVTTQPEAVAPETEENVTAEDVEEQPEELIGQTVTIRGNAGRMVDNVTFTITEDQFFEGDEILVVNTSGQPFVLPEDNDIKVQVTGEVRQFKVVEFEEEFDLDLQADTDYENKPAIVADSIALAPEPEEISENPSLFYGQPIAVEGEVEEIWGANTFTFDEEDLPVLTVAAPAQAIEEGETVVVTGQVRPFVIAEIERDYDLTWDLELQKNLEAEYTNKPVLIADTVYPSAE